MKRKFFATAKYLPPLGVPVYVIWDGRGPFEAARVKDPRKENGGRAAWLTHVKGEAVLLPLTAIETADSIARARTAQPQPKPWAGFHTLQGKGSYPEYWSPKDGARWKLPDAYREFEFDLPPKMWTAHQAFNAAEAAEEMEADRETARASGVEHVRGSKRTLWWLDADGIKYARPGAITRKDAEARIMRALCGESFESGAAATRLQRGMADADLKALAEIDAERPPEFHARFAPLPQDANDYLAAIAWFAALGLENADAGTLARQARRQGKLALASWNDTHVYTPKQRALVFASRDMGLSFGEIATAMKVKRQWAHALYKAAIEDIWEIANGAATSGVVARGDALAAVRDGNRRAKRAREAVGSGQ